MTPLQESGSVRWNALHPYDEHSALIVPRDDLRALEAERTRYRIALEAAAEKFADLEFPVYADACRRALDV